MNRIGKGFYSTVRLRLCYGLWALSSTLSHLKCTLNRKCSMLFFSSLMDALGVIRKIRTIQMFYGMNLPLLNNRILAVRGGKACRLWADSCSFNTLEPAHWLGLIML